MKKIIITIILFSVFSNANAANWCTRENSLEVKNISNLMYELISQKRSQISTPLDKYLFTKAIFSHIFEIKSLSQNDIVTCSISGIWYRLNGDSIWLSKQIDITSEKFKLLPQDIQKNIIDSKNWVY